MKKIMSKPLSVALAIVLILALTITALAAWPSFQNDNTNNGVIAPGSPPPTTQPSVTPIQLSNNGAWVGVDVPSVTDDRGYAYTLYNGGNISGTTGGARLAITDLSANTSQDYQISANTSNGFQLSTPYLTTDGRTYTLYVLVQTTSSNWELHSVDVTNALSPVVSGILAQGPGQPNTPITADNDENPQYLYFGTFTGSKSGSYYQYEIGGATPLTPANIKDDFYWAGATIATITDSEGETADYVVFGSDSSHIYVNPVGTGFATPANNITLDPAGTPITNPGAVRSSVMQHTDSQGNSYVLFTSQGGSNTSGILWKLDFASLLGIASTTNGTLLSGKGSSTSTPVWSDNDKVYVGTYASFTSGTVEVYDPLNGTPNPPKLITTVYGASGGDPVQSSIIVWSQSPLFDYVYFTTNSGSGAGYCYQYNINTQAATQMWTVPNNTANPYSLQGMAYSSEGYVVWGDDGNYFYIAP